MALRKYTRHLLAALVLGAAPLAATPALANDSAATNDSELTIGIGAGVAPSYAGSDDYIALPGAMMRGRYDGFAFFTRGPNLYVDVLRGMQFKGFDLEFGPVVNYRPDRSGRIKDSQVAALGELDAAWELGGWVGIGRSGVLTSPYDSLSFRVSVIQDVSGAHKSFMVSPSIEYGTPLSKTSYLGLSASLDYVGKGFGSYYYNIDSVGALASGLTAYSGAGDKAGFSRLNTALFAAKSLSGDLRKGWAIIAIGSYGRMLGRYKDSPIVRDAGSAGQWLGGLGVAYTF